MTWIPVRELCYLKNLATWNGIQAMSAKGKMSPAYLSICKLNIID
jgi:hypothetical protein